MQRGIYKNSKTRGTRGPNLEGFFVPSGWSVTPSQVFRLFCVFREELVGNNPSLFFYNSSNIIKAEPRHVWIFESSVAE
jgi:hypothetical protein